MACPSHTIALLLDQVLLATEEFLVAPTLSAANMGSKYLVSDESLSLYARIHLGPVGKYRYGSFPVSREGGPRVFVFANIELAPDLQKQGFLTQLLAKFAAAGHFDVIEFENVLNPSLAAWLHRTGYQAKGERTFGGSFFKLLAETVPHQDTQVY